MTDVEDLSRRLRTLSRSIRSNLEDGIVPFWEERAVDEAGGYFTNFDAAGRALPTPVRYLNSQCRLLWWFSRLAREGGNGFAHQAAEHGLAFIRASFADKDNGGWFWTVSADGDVLDDAKIVYGQSFALYALAEASAAGLGAAGDARATFDALQIHAADNRHGGYLEYFDRSWVPLAAGAPGGARKTLDTHLHLLESFTSLVELTGAELHRRRLANIVCVVCTRLLDPVSGTGMAHVDPLFGAIPAIVLDRTWNAERAGASPAALPDVMSFGHDLELSWLLGRVVDVLGTDPLAKNPGAGSIEGVQRRLLDYGVECGLDREHGGVFRDGDRTGNVLVDDKEWWQQAESLVGFLDGFARFADERYLEAAELVWRFVEKHLIVSPLGEWRRLTLRNGSPIDSELGNPWKVSYHTGRALLESLDRIDRALNSSLLRAHR